MKKPFIILLFLVLLVAPLASKATDKHFYFTTSDSVQLYVRIAGEGKPCLFIHGGPGSWTKYFYALGGDVVEQDMTMIYVDQRGCGRSSSPANNDYSLARVVQDFEELRAHLRYEKWLLMPHSFGGTIATEYAYTKPEQVAAVIYVNSTLNLEEAKHNSINNAARIMEVPVADILKPGVSLTDAFNGVMYSLNQKDLMYKMMYRDKAQFQAMAAVMDTTLNWSFGSNVWNHKEYEQDFTVKSAGIKVPVLVFAGKYDYSVGPEHHKTFRFPNAKYHHMATGHCPYQEQPQQFRQHVRRFLAKLG